MKSEINDRTRWLVLSFSAWALASEWIGFGWSSCVVFVVVVVVVVVVESSSLSFEMSSNFTIFYLSI